MAEVDLLSAGIDSPRNIYASKYRAVEILDTLDSQISAQKEGKSELEVKKLDHQLSRIRYKSGILHYATEETKNAEKALNSSLVLQPNVSGFTSDLEDVIQTMDIYNHLCMIMFEREEFEICLNWLAKSELLYLDYSSSSATDRPLTSELESTYTSTCFYFAQVYGRLEQTAQSGIYCERTLFRKYESGTYDAREISQFCLQIASYYQSECRWYQALYIIAAAYEISKPLKDPQIYSEISLFMAKFFVEYLESQQERHAYLPPNEEVKRMKNLELDSEFERSQLDGVSLTALATASQIEPWINQGSAWFTRALNYFVLDGFTTEHVSICLERDHMLALALQSFSDRKLKKTILKRRLAFVQPLITTLSPNHFFQLVQQLLFTTAEIYEHIVDLTELPLPNGLETSSTPAPAPNDQKKERKLNKRVVSAVKYYQDFLETIMGPGGQLPSHLDDGVIESFFRAHLSLGKLHQRFRSANKAVLVAMTQKAAAYYKLTDTLARAYRPTVLQQELQLCAELHRLLTAKAVSMSKGL